MRQHHLTICVTHDVIRIRLNRRNLNKDIRFKSDKKGGIVNILHSVTDDFVAYFIHCILS